MKAKLFFYNLLLLVFIILPAFFLYYILVNTVMANSVLPNVRINSYDVSFYSEVDLKSKVEYQAIQNLPNRAEIIFEDVNLGVSTDELGIKVDTYSLVNYGKGTDIFKVISDGVNLLKGVNVDVTYSINSDSLLNKLGINISSQNPSYISNNELFCSKNNFYFNDINKEQLSKDFIKSLQTKSVFNLNLTNYLKNIEDKSVYTGCYKYNQDSQKIKDLFLDELSEDAEVKDYFSLLLNEGDYVWMPRSDKLGSLLSESKKDLDTEAVEGNYEFLHDKILLFSQYSLGKELDVNATLSVLNEWLNLAQFNKSPIVFNQKLPKVVQYGFPIYDFTNELAKGKTRIELKRNGFDNFVIPYTMFGLDEINKTIIYPGEEFSYIKAIAPQPNGTTKSGRPINSGICNSTTTIFRAALETGLPITDRSYHAFNVDSYNWGYPLNIVDAAYFTNPVVDFKFKNDFTEPIILVVSYEKDTEYQYNSVSIYSSEKVEKRNVELSNWRIWDKYGSKVFKGEFDRKVSIADKVLFTDSFFSQYY